MDAEYVNPVSPTKDRPAPTTIFPDQHRRQLRGPVTSDAFVRAEIRAGRDPEEAVEAAAERYSDQELEPDRADEASELTGEELHDRAAELDIEGRSKMSADELRDAVAQAEAG